jgi:hypothetical protein
MLSGNVSNGKPDERRGRSAVDAPAQHAPRVGAARGKRRARLGKGPSFASSIIMRARHGKEIVAD